LPDFLSGVCFDIFVGSLKEKKSIVAQVLFAYLFSLHHLKDLSKLRIVAGTYHYALKEINKL